MLENCGVEGTDEVGAEEWCFGYAGAVDVAEAWGEVFVAG